MDVNWGALSEDEKRRALLNDELVQVGAASFCWSRKWRGWGGAGGRWVERLGAGAELVQVGATARRRTG